MRKNKSKNKGSTSEAWRQPSHSELNSCGRTRFDHFPKRLTFLWPLRKKKQGKHSGGTKLFQYECEQTLARDIHLHALAPGRASTSCAVCVRERKYEFFFLRVGLVWQWSQNSVVPLSKPIKHSSQVLAPVAIYLHQNCHLLLLGNWIRNFGQWPAMSVLPSWTVFLSAKQSLAALISLFILPPVCTCLQSVDPW